MDNAYLSNIVDKVFINIFGQGSPFSLEQILSEFAFDIKLPQQVIDSTTGEKTWAASINPTKFITQTNMEKYDISRGWMLPKRTVRHLDDILTIWKSINYMTTERYYDCINTYQSDTIYRSENVYRCVNCNDCKNIIFSDGCGSCEYTIASQRTGNSSFCLRVDDSGSCSSSYNVICSAKISNSYFIQDCNNLHECIFCSHIANKRYYIANMPFEKEEYFQIKKQIIKWILNIK